MKINNLIIETKHLTFRHFEVTDADDYFEILSDEQTCLDCGGFHAYRTRNEDYNKRMERYALQETRYVLVLKSEQKVIGCIVVMEEKESLSGTYELGYVIHPKFRRCGYAYEALSAFVQQCFQIEDVKGLIASIYPYNKGSRNLLKKLGFTYSHTIVDAMNHMKYGWINLEYYSLDKWYTCVYNESMK